MQKIIETIETEEDNKSVSLVSTEEPHVFGTIQKFDHIMIMIALNNWKGSKYIDIRQWWKSYGQDNYQPTKLGITITLKEDLEMLEEFVKIMQQALEYVKNNFNDEQNG